VLWTRNLNVVTSSYPEVAAALSETFDRRGRIVFDGEIVALAQGRPSFARLQKRANTLRPTTALRRQVPVTYLPFDVLAADGGDLTAAPYLERRAALSDLGHELHGPGLPIQILPHWVSVDGAVILEAARTSMMEGAVFKKVSSPYLPGQRARSWRKVLLRTRSSALVVGWVPGGGVQRNMVGALVLGAYDDTGNAGYSNVRNASYRALNFVLLAGPELWRSGDLLKPDARAAQSGSINAPSAPPGQPFHRTGP